MVSAVFVISVTTWAMSSGERRSPRSVNGRGTLPAGYSMVVTVPWMDCPYSWIGIAREITKAL